jgi:hypothetical protein
MAISVVVALCARRVFDGAVDVRLT